MLLFFNPKLKKHISRYIFKYVFKCRQFFNPSEVIVNQLDGVCHKRSLVVQQKVSTKSVHKKCSQKCPLKAKEEWKVRKRGEEGTRQMRGRLAAGDGKTKTKKIYRKKVAHTDRHCDLETESGQWADSPKVSSPPGSVVSKRTSRLIIKNRLGADSVKTVILIFNQAGH